MMMVVGDSVDIFDTGDIFDTDVDKIDIVTTFNLNLEKVDIVEAISKTQLSIKNARQKCELYYRNKNNNSHATFPEMIENDVSNILHTKEIHLKKS